ncbi:MAG: hypothetical protein KC400_01225, partial [Methanolinea sp.]|nr:hypothetical protein [Methanolinea sp.]
FIGRQPPVYMQLSDTPRGSASLAPAVVAHPNKAIGTVSGIDDQTLQYPDPPCPPDIACGGSGGGSPLSA